MSNSGILLTMIALAQIGGFFLLALSQPRHWQAVIGSSASSRRMILLLRVTGSVWIFASFPLTLWRDGVEFGVLLWFALLSVAAVVTTLALAWWPHRTDRGSSRSERR